jgi:hypothetical protein
VHAWCGVQQAMRCMSFKAWSDVCHMHITQPVLDSLASGLCAITQGTGVVISRMMAPNFAAFCRAATPGPGYECFSACQHRALVPTSPLWHGQPHQAGVSESLCTHSNFPTTRRQPTLSRADAKYARSCGICCITACGVLPTWWCLPIPVHARNRGQGC